MTTDLATLMTTPQEILDQLTESCREVKALEPSMLPTLEKAASALSAWDQHNSAVSLTLQEENVPIEVVDVLYHLIPVVGQLYDAFHAIEMMCARAADGKTPQP